MQSNQLQQSNFSPPMQSQQSNILFPKADICKCQIARYEKKNKSENSRYKYFTTVSLVQYNKLQKDSVRFHEKEYENLKSRDKKSYEEKNEEDNQTEFSRIRDFFNNFQPPFLHEMEISDLYISLIKS